MKDYLDVVRRYKQSQVDAIREEFHIAEFVWGIALGAVIVSTLVINIFI